MQTFDKFAAAIEQENVAEIERLISSGFALDEKDEDGTPLLFLAIIQSNIQIVRLLLENGADVNIEADEPAATVYDRTPLDLVQGLRFLLDWDKYQPIAKLLVEFGATDLDGHPDFNEVYLKELEQKAKEFQARNNVKT